MKFIFKWLNRKLSDTRENLAMEKHSTMVDTHQRIDSFGMNFTVYRANGGHIIETRRYDKKRDCNENSLHIITDDKDLGEEIGRIITFENLRS